MVCDAITLTANRDDQLREGGALMECVWVCVSVCLKWPMCLKCAAQYLLILLSASVVWLCGYGLM